jgi:hypothetical protein
MVFLPPSFLNVDDNATYPSMKGVSDEPAIITASARGSGALAVE